MADNHLTKNDPRNASPEAFDHLVYLRLWEGCNLHCEHCFIPANPKRMSLEQIRQVPDIVSQFAKRGDRVLLQWHGGEPTALGPEVMRQSLEAIHAKDIGVHWVHGLQTNLMTYDSNWREIFKEWFDSSVGVSWDPQIRLTKVGRPESNKDYEERFWPKLHQLVEDGISPYLVVTGTRVFFERFKDPFEFFELMEAHGIPHGHIERLTRTGYARNNWQRIGLTNLEYSQWMGRFARAYAIYQARPRSGEQPFKLSPFDGLLHSVDRLSRGEGGGYGCLSGACDTRFHTIDSNGYKAGCTALTSEYDNKRAGEQVVFFSNILKERDARRLVGPSCLDCQFKTICSSGCLASDKVDESGECSGGYRLFETLKSIHRAHFA